MSFQCNIHLNTKAVLITIIIITITYCLFHKTSLHMIFKYFSVTIYTIHTLNFLGYFWMRN